AGPLARGCARDDRRSRREGIAGATSASRIPRRFGPRHHPLNRRPGVPLPKQLPQRSDAPTIGIVAGAASGDALPATLIHAAREERPRARIVGTVGPRGHAAGCGPWI